MRSGCFNKAAIANSGCACVKRAAYVDCSCLHAPQQDDAAFVFSDGMRFNNTGVVDHAGKQCIFGAGIHDD